MAAQADALIRRLPMASAPDATQFCFSLVKPCRKALTTREDPQTPRTSLSRRLGVSRRGGFRKGCRRNSCFLSQYFVPSFMRRNSSLKTIALFLLFRVQSFVYNSSCKGVFQMCAKCGCHGRYCNCTSCRLSPFSKYSWRGQRTLK